MFRDFFYIVIWLGIIFDVNFMWSRIRAPFLGGALGIFVWCCGHFSSCASGFTYCLKGFTNSCFRLAVQRMISAKSWKVVKHKLSLAQRRVKKSWEEWGPQISLSWGSLKPQNGDSDAEGSVLLIKMGKEDRI